MVARQVDDYLRILRGVGMETSCFSDVESGPFERGFLCAPFTP